MSSAGRVTGTICRLCIAHACLLDVEHDKNDMGHPREIAQTS